MPDWDEYERKHGFIRVRLRLTPSGEGGRARAIGSGYRSCWDIGNRSARGSVAFNDAPLAFEDVDSLEPGAEATARLHPLFPQYWTHVTVGAVLYAHEGARRVGTATVVEIVPPDGRP